MSDVASPARGLDVARARAARAALVPHASAGAIAQIVVALFSVVLVAAPVLVGGGVPVSAVCTLPFLVCIAWAAPRSRRVAGAAMVALSLYVLTIVLALLRGARAGIGTDYAGTLAVIAAFLAVVGFGITLVASARDHNELKRRMVAVALAPAVYVAVNVVLYQIIGPGKNLLTFQSGEAELLGTIGISATRIVFPLSGGSNAFGAVAAAGIAASALLFATRSTDRKLAAAAGAICLYGALATDSRAALIVAALIIAILILVPRLHVASGVALVISVAPILVIVGLSLVNADLVASLSRNGTDFATATQRLPIWSGVWSILSHPQPIHLIGYGAYGQVTSGASLSYAYLFASETQPYAFTTHNLLLQTILDTGYFGVAALVAAVATACMRLQAVRLRGRSPATALLAMIAVLFLAGTTEAIPSYLNPECLGLALLLLAVASALDPAQVVPKADDG